MDERALFARGWGMGQSTNPARRAANPLSCLEVSPLLRPNCLHRPDILRPRDEAAAQSPWFPAAGTEQRRRYARRAQLNKEQQQWDRSPARIDNGLET